MDTTVTDCFGENSQGNNLFLSPSPSDDTTKLSDEDTNYNKWKKLIIVAQSIRRFRSLRVEKIQNQVITKSSLNFIFKVKPYKKYSHRSKIKNDFSEHQ